MKQVIDYGYDGEVARRYVIKYWKNFLSLREIAKEIGLSVNTVRKIIDSEPISKGSRTKLLKWASTKQKKWEKYEKYGERLDIL